MSPTPRIQAIAFDLDGTLVDSAPDIRHALNSALTKAGLRPFDLDAVRAWIGDGPDTLIVSALTEQGIDPADSELRARLRRSFDMTTLAAPLSLGTVYDGMADLMAAWQGSFAMVVVTNKPTPLARAVLKAAQLLPYLTEVYGADTRELRKPAPGMLHAAAARLAVPPAGLLMVGDGPADLLAAQAAGCPAALVGWGYGSHAVPEGLQPWRVKTPQQLLAGLAAQAGQAARGAQAMQAAGVAARAAQAAPAG
ncbi:MAG TPA: HAD-IA family hydrolase [Ideonella sp.]|nr:HAD-IA family hydrolase [Ideonella sp.]